MHLSFRGRLQSPAKTMTVIHSEDLLLQVIYVSSTSNSNASVVNTDRAETINANNIIFNPWSVTNRNDCISPKANRTKMLVTNFFFN